MRRKIIQVGTSAAVILPKSILNETQTKIGDEVEIHVQKVGTDHRPPLQISSEVIEWTKRFIKEDKELLNQLKDS